MKENDPCFDLLCDLIRTRPVTANVAAVNRAEMLVREFLEKRKANPILTARWP